MHLPRALEARCIFAWSLSSSPSGALGCIPLPAPCGRENLSVQKIRCSESIAVLALMVMVPGLARRRIAQLSGSAS
jgi:hypothetical protein